jgi:hypothetical protein
MSCVYFGGLSKRNRTRVWRPSQPAGAATSQSLEYRLIKKELVREETR